MIRLFPEAFDIKCEEIKHSLVHVLRQTQGFLMFERNWFLSCLELYIEDDDKRR